MRSRVWAVCWVERLLFVVAAIHHHRTMRANVVKGYVWIWKVVYVYYLLYYIIYSTCACVCVWKHAANLVPWYHRANMYAIYQKWDPGYSSRQNAALRPPKRIAYPTMLYRRSILHWSVYNVFMPVCITLHTQNVYMLSLKRVHCSIKYICAFCETVCRHIDDADADTRWCRDPRCRNWVLTGLRSVAFGVNGKCGVEWLMRNLIWAICVSRTLRITRCAPLVGVLCWRQRRRWWWCVKRFHDTYLRSWWDAMRRQRANCEGVMSERTANRILVR